jgi:p-cumate 2,3-dioxygenase alpha subunit
MPSSNLVKIDAERGRFRVSRRVFTDPAIFALERDRILLKSWMYLGHESEIRAVNDYIVRLMIGKSVILVRDREGKVRAFINTCPHRGTQICRDERGNRKTFSCPYHGWTFRNSGELLSQNTERGYSARFNEDGAYNLSEVPRLETRRGMVFINFDPEAVALAEYLADAGDRIDMIADHSPDGVEVIEGCHEYAIRANYKLMAENSYDGYHLGPAHGSYLDYQRAILKGAMREDFSGRALSLGNGHACFETDLFAGRPIAQWLPVWGEEARLAIEEQRRLLVQRVGEKRGAIIANIHRNTVVFPTTMINDERTILVRSVLPLSHNEMIVRSWALAPVNEPAILRKIRLENAISFLGPGGFATPDDIELLESCQRGYESGGIGWNDVSKGFRPDERTANDSADWSDELQMRAFWLQYDKLMAA